MRQPRNLLFLCGYVYLIIVGKSLNYIKQLLLMIKQHLKYCYVAYMNNAYSMKGAHYYFRVRICSFYKIICRIIFVKQEYEELFVCIVGIRCSLSIIISTDTFHFLSSCYTYTYRHHKRTQLFLSTLESLEPDYNGRQSPMQYSLQYY